MIALTYVLWPQVSKAPRDDPALRTRASINDADCPVRDAVFLEQGDDGFRAVQFAEHAGVPLDFFAEIQALVDDSGSEAEVAV